MALTQDPRRALSEAIDAFLKAAGDDPKLKDVVSKLHAVDSEIGDTGEDAPSRDTAGDHYSFDTAEKRHTERTAANIAASADAGTDGAAGGEGK